MNLLLDTHTLLWLYWNDPKLSPTAARLVADPNNRVFVSSAIHWEVAIKVSIGKLTLRQSFPDFVQHAISGNGFVMLPIEPRHTALVATLPFHHKDPFDRVLVAQALVDNLPIISADSALDAYGVSRLW